MDSNIDYVFDDEDDYSAIQEYKDFLKHAKDFILESYGDKDLKEAATKLAVREYKVDHVFSTLISKRKQKIIMEYFGIAPEGYSPGKKLTSLEKITLAITAASKLADIIQHDEIAMKSLCSSDPGCYAQVLAYRRYKLPKSVNLGKYASGECFMNTITTRASPSDEHMNWYLHLESLKMTPPKNKVGQTFSTYINKNDC